MNGQRLPSHVEIRFQARPDTPGLNCCSVNGPRGYGILSQWAVMQRPDGLAINHWGPMEARVVLKDGAPVNIASTGDYPLSGQVKLRIQTQEPRTFTLALRIPHWSDSARVSVGGTPVADVQPGRYCTIQRTWHDDTLTIALDLGLRYETGDLQQAGSVSLFRGPLLLAADDRWQTLPPQPLELDQLAAAQVIPIDESIRQHAEGWAPARCRRADSGRSAGPTDRLCQRGSDGPRRHTAQPLCHLADCAEGSPAATGQ